MEPHFSAQVRVYSDQSNQKTARQGKVNAQATQLNTRYAHIPNEKLRVSIDGILLMRLRDGHGDTGKNTSSLTAKIYAEQASGEFAYTEVFWRAGTLLREPIWLFFRRVRRETDKLIKAAGIE